MSAQQTVESEAKQRDRPGEMVPPRPAPPPPKPNGQPADGQGQHPQQGQHGEPIPKDLPRPGTFWVVVVCLVMVACLAGLFVLGWIPRQRAQEQARNDAAEQEQVSGTPQVTVAHPKVEQMPGNVLLPCTVKANQQAALYSRSTGYLKQWTFDIGSRVKEGQLLAVISAPDVDAQLAQTKAALEQAKATVIKSQADVEVALADYNRFLKSQKDNPGSVTQEDVDTKRGAYEDAAGALKVANAAVDQNAAAVQQLTVAQGFERITAPFSGTITARNYDVGALITASNTAAGAELFDIADTDTLRVFVNVPQTYATNIKVGQPGYLSVRNYPQREFNGTVARMTGALDATTRTIPFEVDFPNPDGLLYAGMYGEARLPVVEPHPPLVVPSSALIFNAGGAQLALVRDSKVYFQKVTVGRDLGTDLEITNGLKGDDLIVINPGERLGEGVTVTTKEQTEKPAATRPS